MTSSSNDTDREAVCSAVGSVLVNASNYPAKVSFRMLGLDLGPLIDKVTDAILIEFLPGYTERVKAEAWNESAAAHRKGIVTTEWHKWPANPYRRES